ncbi:putative gustatory receptor 9a [Drosophila biarmipes]|uniref:putative gustatory receptor 9a n=1 Tax=Drosophila biarmipes TaxID=125945 RepID=UPI0007E79E99|nr:putative gustatory receptor 9a [Drosophila biarmipes]
MSLWLERCTTGYFQLFGLACGWSGSRLGRLLGSTFLLIILIELANEIVNYFKGALPHGEPLSTYFVKTIQTVNVAYKMVHSWIVLTALFECKRFRRLLEQLPLVRSTSFIYRHLVLELVLAGWGLNLILVEYNTGGLYLESLQFAFSLQAVRARYLQVTLMVDRLDGQLEQLHHRVVTRATDYKTLRCEYAHLAKLSRSLSRLYGLSLLQLNILCLGDCIILCNVYFMVEYLKTMPGTWFVFAQTTYIVLPTLVKISTLCAACQRCVAKSKHLQEQLKDRPGQTSSDRSQIEGFALQVMQDPIQFDVCGIYHLNLQTLAGMFFFILEALVIFLQFVSLVRP